MAAFGRMPAQRVLLQLLLLIFCVCCGSTSQISNLRKCADKTCSVTISRATAMARYPSSSPLHLSLSRGDIVEIKSKSAGDRPELWGGMINGRRGYFPKAFVREFDVKVDTPTLDVPTEENQWDGQQKTEQRQPPQQQQPPPTQQQQQQPPPMADEPEQDDTEIDETDLTDLDDLVNEAVEKIQTNPEQPKPAPEQGEAEAKQEDGDGWFGAKMGDPLLLNIEELRKSFADMDDARNDAEALNNFLSNQFTTEAETDKTPDVDETDIEEAANAAKRNEEKDDSGYIAGVMVMEEEGDDEEDDDEGEYGEEYEDPTEEIETPERREEKIPNVAVDGTLPQGGETVTEDRDASEMPEETAEAKVAHKETIPVPKEAAEKVIPKEEEGGEKEVPAQQASPDVGAGVGLDPTNQQQASPQDPPAGVPDIPEPSSAEEAEVNKPQAAVPVPDSIVDPASQQTGQNVVKQVIPDRVPEGVKDSPADQNRHGGPGNTLGDQNRQEGPGDTLGDQNRQGGPGDTLGDQNRQGGPEDALRDQTQQFGEPPNLEKAGKVDVVPGDDDSPDDTGPTGGDVEVPGAESVDPRPAGGEAAGTPPPPPQQAEETNDNLLFMTRLQETEAEENDAQQGVDPAVLKQTVATPPPEDESQQKTEESLPEGQTGGETATPTDSGSLEKQEQEHVPEVEKVAAVTGEQEQQQQQQQTIQPEKTQGQPVMHSGAYQPVDIDFVAGQPQDGRASLQSSQGAGDAGLPDQQTAASQATPSLQQAMAQSSLPATTPNPQEGSQAGPGNQEPTTVIDGTRFYLVDGEPADIVPESVPVHQGVISQMPPVETSVPPPEATRVLTDAVVPTQTTTTGLPDVLPDTTPPPISTTVEPPLQDVKIPDPSSSATTETESRNATGFAASGSDAIPDQPKIPEGQYQTSADVLSRSLLSVNSLAAGQQGNSQAAVPASDPVVEQTPNQQNSNTEQAPAVSDVNSVKTPASEIQASASVVDAGAASVTVEGEEGGTDSDSSLPQTADSAGIPESDNNVEAGTGEGQEAESAEYLTPEPMADGGIPPRIPGYDADATPPPQEEVNEEPTVEGDPYQMDDYNSRKINDEELSKSEEDAYPARTDGSLEAQSKAFIDKLPPSIQSLLEQEPLGLSPVMTILVTVTTFVMFISMTFFSCLCSPGGKKAGTKDPLVVVRELEEKLLMAVKEKENLEDALQERQSQNKRVQSESADNQTKLGAAKNDLQNVTLHNEVLKKQVAQFQSDMADLKDQLSKKNDDTKSKDKKGKETEKETKKLQDSNKTLEKNLQKKENERQRLTDENENLKGTVQSLTDQIQQLDNSKQQLLAEADDWKEKVDELKERCDQVEQANRSAQETISFKDSELEVMKDCYLQLKSFEKSGGDDEEEEDDLDAASNEDVQEKIKTMMDVSKVNATLRAVQEERDNLDNKLKIEHGARTELEEQLECVRREMESSMADKMKAERQCQESATKLNVLSSYFKDKEIQLQRELGEHEALKKQNLSKLDNADESTRSMLKEVELSKQQVDSLRRELTASERDFRSQIAANEKKAHENWLNARAAERELKECKHESAVLRQKLTDSERRNMEPALIRPMPTRGMPPPGMMNGPPPPGMERSPSRGSMPPGGMPPGPPHPPFREPEFPPMTARERERLPPSHPARHMPPLPHPGPPDGRSPPPRMHPDLRASPPRMLPPDGRSPPPYDRRGGPMGPHPPPPMGARSPPMRFPPPHMGSPAPRMDSPRGDPRQGNSPYGRHPPPGGDGRRHQSQV